MSILHPLPIGLISSTLFPITALMTAMSDSKFVSLVFSFITFCSVEYCLGHIRYKLDMVLFFKQSFAICPSLPQWPHIGFSLHSVCQYPSLRQFQQTITNQVPRPRLL